MLLFLTDPVHFCEVFAQRSRDKEVTSYVLVKHETLSLIVRGKPSNQCSSALGRVSGTQQRNYMQLTENELYYFVRSLDAVTRDARNP